MYDYRNKNRPLSSSSHIGDTHASSKSYSAMGNLKSDYLLKNKVFSRNHKIGNADSENPSYKGGKNSGGILNSFAKQSNGISPNSIRGFSIPKRDTCFNSVRLSHDKNSANNDKNLSSQKSTNVR